jgi:hypothetical protein
LDEVAAREERIAAAKKKMEEEVNPTLETQILYSKPKP